ncbi:general secretion pathway protein I [Nitrosomonas eutropha]|uniref:prepilin-type N-terminal cleavage/methylation domain-containing protein n=1 Tax=Nitrosomonas TaxID=914 RepID=UPI00088A7390|nr:MULTISPECIES: prepilin-type N-terminal cleavage/methylation domain-containing protein [Nitrosomonas]MXS80727.1 type II secretion system protein [Nitrosomonas sp. GH22]SCX16349.1 general secretion pathway protein I [Nitrosomonas eutropha]
MGVQRGFSLLEILVTLAVAALFFGVLLPSIVTNLDRIKADTLRAAALLVAQNQMDAHAVIATEMGGRFEGQDGPFSWTATIEPSEKKDRSTGTAGPFLLRRVHVDVFFQGDQPLVSLEAYRVGAVR